MEEDGTDFYNHILDLFNDTSRNHASSVDAASLNLEEEFSNLSKVINVQQGLITLDKNRTLRSKRKDTSVEDPPLEFSQIKIEPNTTTYKLQNKTKLNKNIVEQLKAENRLAYHNEPQAEA